MCPVAVKRQAACEDKDGDRTHKLVGRVQGGSQNACTVKRYNQHYTASSKQIETELYVHLVLGVQNSITGHSEVLCSHFSFKIHLS